MRKSCDWRSAVLAVSLLLLGSGVVAATWAQDPVTGDLCEDPFWFDALPLVITGDTCPYGSDYDVMCPYGANAPDVVYAYTPADDVVARVSLCASTYDTKLIIYENGCTPSDMLACNDDRCEGPYYEYPYLSHIASVPLAASQTYYFVVKGYMNECGVYKLEIDTPEDCVAECPPGGVLEGEPDCYDGYVDTYNRGCEGEVPAFSSLDLGLETVTVCGASGTYFDPGWMDDEDWYAFTLPDSAAIDLAFYAEFPAALQLLGAQEGCQNPIPLTEAYVQSCRSWTHGRHLSPGPYWLRIRPWHYFETECGSAYRFTLAGLPGVSAAPAAPDARATAPIRDLVIRPNPAVGRVQAAYHLDRAARVTLDVLDVTGRRVLFSSSAAPEAPGWHERTWLGRDESGRRAGPGIYFVRVRAGDQSCTRTLHVLR